MAVLRAREGAASPACCSSSAVVMKPTITARASGRATPRAGPHALVLDQLPGRRRSGGRPPGGGEPLRVAAVGQPLLGVARVRGVEARLGEQLLERLLPRRGRQSSTSTPGGISWTPSTTRRPPGRRCGCAEPTIVAGAPTSTSCPADSSRLPRIEVRARAVGLDDVPAAARRADGAARHVVDDTVGRPVLPDRGGVRLDPASSSREQSCSRFASPSLVPVDHEDG